MEKINHEAKQAALEQRKYNASLNSDFLRQFPDPLERSTVAALLVDPVANTVYTTAQVITFATPVGIVGKTFQLGNNLYSVYDGISRGNASAVIAVGLTRKINSIQESAGVKHIIQRMTGEGVRFAVTQGSFSNDNENLR